MPDAGLRSLNADFGLPGYGAEAEILCAPAANGQDSELGCVKELGRDAPTISVVEGEEIRYEVGVQTFEGDSLASGRVRLRPHVSSDAADHVRWRNDAEVAFWATAGDIHFWPVAAAAVDRWFSDKLPEMDPRSDGVFAIDLVNGRHIGMVDYRDVDAVARSATVGITIGEKDLWAQGYGSEALGLLVGYLFDHLNLHRVQLDTWSGNERAMRSFAALASGRKGACEKRSGVLAATSTQW
jgi:RimJ/RimL family protein N-acetyltransferase